MYTVSHNQGERLEWDRIKERIVKSWDFIRAAYFRLWNLR